MVASAVSGVGHWTAIGLLDRVWVKATGESDERDYAYTHAIDNGRKLEVAAVFRKAAKEMESRA